MSDDAITRPETVRFTLDPANPPKTDWTMLDACTEVERTAAALSDPDAQPATTEQLARARRVVRVELIRARFGLTQQGFAERFGLDLETVQAWEAGTVKPDRTAVTLLRVIWADSDAVAHAVAGA